MELVNAVIRSETQVAPFRHRFGNGLASLSELAEERDEDDAVLFGDAEEHDEGDSRRY